jgi:hypothetical protein
MSTTRSTAQIEEMIAHAVQAAQQQMRQEIDAAVGQMQMAQADLITAQNDLGQAQGQIVNLQQQVNQAAAQAAAAPPQVQPQPQPVIVQQAPPPPRAAAVFAYTPGTIGAAAALLDYNTTTGVKIHKAAIEKLLVEFDLDKEHLYEFLEALRTRAIACGWYETLFMVTQQGLDLNIIENYGTITGASAQAKALTYMFHENRSAQDSHNLFMCLEASLSTEARITIYSESTSYTFRRGDVAGAVAGGDDKEKRRDGLMMLWTIINRTTAMTTATISVLLEQLNNLPAAMTEANHDIGAFNTKVRRLLTSYYANKREAYNETALLQNLSRACFAYKDEEFTRYMVQGQLRTRS